MAVLLDFLAVPFLAIFAAVTSWEDIRTGLIRNVWVLAAIVYALASLLAQTILLHVRGEAVNPAYLSIFLTNAVVAVLVGVVVWLGHLWSAADAKMFFAYAMVVPLHWYEKSLIQQFPALALLVNSLLPVAAWYVLVTLYRLATGTHKEEIRSAIKEALAPMIHLELILFLFGFSWLLSIAPLTVPLLIVLLLLVYSLGKPLLGVWFVRLSAAAAVARLLFQGSALLSLAFAKQFLLTYLAIAFLFIFLLKAGKAAFSDLVPVERLQAGMIPTQDLGGGIPAHRSEGLSEDEVKQLKKMLGDGKVSKGISIAQSVPFAPFMALGVLLAALLQGNILL